MSFRFKTSTDIVPLVCVGTYWGPFEYERLWGCEIERIKEDGGIVCDDYDNKKFGKALATAADEVFDEEKPLEDAGVVRIRAIDFYSPREYNFSDDDLTLEVEVVDDFLERSKAEIMKPENKDKVSKFIEENWKTRDGFISYMPCESYYDLEQLFEDLAAAPKEEYYDEYRMWGTVLCLVAMLNKYIGSYDDDDADLYSDLTWAIENKILDNKDIGDFCTVFYDDGWKKEYKGHIVDFDAFRKKLDDDLEKYVESGVGEDSIEKAKRFHNSVMDRVAFYERETADTVANWHPDKKSAMKYLDELRDEWKKERDGKWEEFWK